MKYDDNRTGSEKLAKAMILGGLALLVLAGATALVKLVF